MFSVAILAGGLATRLRPASVARSRLPDGAFSVWHRTQRCSRIRFASASMVASLDDALAAITAVDSSVNRTVTACTRISIIVHWNTLKFLLVSREIHVTARYLLSGFIHTNGAGRLLGIDAHQHWLHVQMAC